MAKSHAVRVSETPATRFLDDRRVAYTEHAYAYADHGGTSPFGTRKPLPVYMERSILQCPKIYINGGRGYLVGIDPAELVRVLAPTMVEVALP